MGNFKTCACCGQTKRIDKFYRARKSKDGLQSWCIQCTKEAVQQKRKSDKLEAAYRQVHSAEEALRG